MIDSFPGIPFSSIVEWVVLKILAIQSRHLVLKPLCSNNTIIYSQEMVSKALEMSNLKSKAEIFVLSYALAKFLTYIKLSCMHLLFIKALCHTDIMLSMRGDRQMARVFVMSFPNVWIRLLGLKSPGFFARSDLGMRTIFAPFSLSKGLVRRL